MKTLFFTITLAISTLMLQAQTETQIIEEGTTITVIVPAKSYSGKVVFGLFDESTFLKEPILGTVSTITDGKAIAKFDGVWPGTYAIVLFHDKNENNMMDFEVNGMPSENYAVSNNTYGYGPPQWHEAKFEVKNMPIEMIINL